MEKKNFECGSFSLFPPFDLNDFCMVFAFFNSFFLLLLLFTFQFANASVSVHVRTIKWKQFK